MSVGGGGAAPKARSAAEGFGATLSLEAVQALCDGLGIAPPAVHGSGGPLRADDDRRPASGARLAGLTEQGAPRPDDGDGPLATALALLGSPDISITVLREGPISSTTGSIGVAGDRAAQLWPVGDGRLRVTLYAAADVVMQVVALCELADRPVPVDASLTMSPALLLAVSDRVAAGDVPAAEALLVGADSTVGARAAFLRAMVLRRAGCQVTVLDRRDPGRLRGTVTAWLDGGGAGLWRVPPTGFSPGAGGVADHRLRGMALEIRAVRRADLVAEITDGFPELTLG